MVKGKSKKSKHTEKQKKQPSSGFLLALDNKVVSFFKKKWSVPLLFAIISIAYFANFIFADNAFFTTDGGILGKPVKGLDAFTNPFMESGYWYHGIMGGQPGAQGLTEWIYYLFYNVFLLFVIGYRSAAIYIALLTFVAGYFMYLFIRSLNIRNEIAVITGLFYMSSPMLLSFVLAGHMSKMGVISLLPLMFLCLEKAISTQKVRYYVLLGGSISLAIGTAHLQFAYFSFWAIGFYFIYKVVTRCLADKDLPKLAKHFGLFACAVVLGLTIGARGFIPQYVHTSTVSKRAITGEAQPGAPSSFEYAASWSLNPEEIGSLLLPHFGNYNDDYWGRNALKQNSEYFGLYPLLLFFAGLLLWRTERRVRFFSFLFFFALLFALGANTPFFKLIYYVIPGVKMFRAPSIISFLFSFSAAVVMALFFERVLIRNPQKDEKDYKSKEKHIKRTKVFFYCSFITGAVFMIFSKQIISIWDAFFTMDEVWVPNVAQVLRQRMLNNTAAISIDAFIMLVFCGILFLILYAYWNKKIGMGVFVVIVGIIVIADTWRINSDFRQARPYDNIPTGKDTQIAALENLKELDRSPYRIFAEYAYAPGGSGQKYAYPGHFLPFAFLDFTLKRMDRVQAFFHTFLRANGSIYLPILNLMNVKYYIATGQRNDPNLLLKSVLGQHFVYENLAAHPYFAIVHRYRVIENPDEALTTVLGPAFSANREVILEKPPPDFAVSRVDSAELSSVQDEIEYLGVRDFYSPIQNTFQFRVSAEHPGFVLLSNNYHHQWKATVDGTDTEIYQANYLWMGVFVPEGDHDVVFTFFTPWVKYSRMVSFIGMLIFGILLILSCIMERRAPKSESENQG